MTNHTGVGRWLELGGGAGATIISGVGRCLILGGPNFFSDIYMTLYTLLYVHLPAFYVCKAHNKKF